MPQKYKNLIQICEAHIKQPIDRKFMMKVLLYVSSFARRDEAHINFLGGNLIGAYPIKWVSEDRFKWVEDVLEIQDYDQLCLEIYDLPDINKAFIVSSNAVNLSFLWVAHQALKSEHLNPKDRYALAHAAINMLQYKFVSSIHTHNFKYAADMGVALAVYEALDNKSQLKRLGSWQALIDARSDDILGIDSLHTVTIRALETDLAVAKMVNDIWNRLKSIIKILTDSFYHIRDIDAKLASTSKFTQIDGEAILKDSFNHYGHIKSVMQNLVPDRNAFIRDDLINIITLAVTTVYPIYLRDSLRFMSENFSAKHKHIDIPTLVDDILIYAFGIIREEKIELHNIPTIAIKLRGVLRSSRITDREYLSIKDRTAVIIKAANTKITEVNIASTRVALLLYVILRALLPK